MRIENHSRKSAARVKPPSTLTDLVFAKSRRRIFGWIDETARLRWTNGDQCLLLRWFGYLEWQRGGKYSASSSQSTAIQLKRRKDKL